MATYTYEVDHGDDNPRVFAGMDLNGGKVTAVQFDSALTQLEKLEAAAQSLVDWYGENTPGTYKPPGMAELQSLLNTRE